MVKFDLPTTVNLWRDDVSLHPLHFGLPFSDIVPRHYSFPRIRFESEISSFLIEMGDKNGDFSNKKSMSHLIWKRPQALQAPVVPISPIQNPNALVKGKTPNQFLPESKFFLKLIELIENRPGIGKHFARSSVRHLNFAFNLLEYDMDMAWFRAFLAKEEMAKAIHYALVRKKYVNASKLKSNDHIQMLSIWAFFKIMAKWFQDYVRSEIIINDKDGPFLRWNENNQSWSLQIRFPGMPKGIFLEPVPPLEFTVYSDSDIFLKAIEQIINDKNVTSFEDLLKKEFQERNLILYATDAGVGSIQQVSGNQKSIWLSDITLMACAYLLIDMHVKQSFPQTCLDYVIELHKNFLKSKNKIT